MLAFALTSAWQRRRRLAGTVTAVVLGVSFLAATLVTGATARAGFRDTYVTANAGIDVYVRSSQRLTGGVENVRPPVPAATVDDVSGVDGVARSAPVVEGTAQLVGDDGRPLDGGRPTTAAEAWIDDPELTGWLLADGRAPGADDEIVIDRATAEAEDLAVGDELTVLTPATTEATVVGIATFGDEDTRVDANLVAFTTGAAQRLLLGSPDVVSAVAVAGEDGVADTELAAAVAERLPAGVEAVTGADLTAEQQAEVEADLVDALTTGLLAFAFVSLVVAAFGIANTFTILAAQRVRESALLRAVGASRRQVLAAALVEAGLVGAAGSVLGVVLGAALASVLLAATAAIGFDLPSDGLLISPRDVLVAVVVGLALTVCAALPAAWHAARVAPVAALRDPVRSDGSSSRRRAVAGLVATGLGALLVVAAGGGALGNAAIGAVLLLAGLVLLGPVAAGPVIAALGRPLAARSVEGDLAVRNAVRNPRRSAATATALLVGVGVVSLFTVFGASAARSVDEAVERAFAGDLALTPVADGVGLAPETLDAVADVPEVAAVAGVGRGPAVVDGVQDDLAFADLAALPAVLDLAVVEGDLAGATGGGGGLAASVDEATERGWALGDTVPVGFADGSAADLRLVATYESEAVVGATVVERSVWEERDAEPYVELAVIALADGVSVEDGQAAVEAATAGPGAPLVQDRDAFAGAEVAQVSGILDVVYGLLVIAIVIALMGIANTLSLSIHERTRELGVLRAVGQSRAQLRAMVRWESVLVAVFGAAGGIGLGVFVAWGVVRALDARADIATFTLPLGPLVAVAVTGALVGVLAGIVPARRAARLDVLDAVSGV